MGLCHGQGAGVGFPGEETTEWGPKGYMGTKWGKKGRSGQDVQMACDGGLCGHCQTGTLASVPRSAEVRVGGDAARQRRAGFLGSCTNYTSQCSLWDSCKPKMWHFSEVI